MATATVVKKSAKPAVVGVHQISEGKRAGQWHARRNGKDVYGKSRSEVRAKANALNAPKPGVEAPAVAVEWSEEQVAAKPVKYNLSINDSGASVVTFVLEGEIKTIGDEHPFYARIVDSLARGESVADLLDVKLAVATGDERIEVQDDAVYFEGEPMHSHLLDSFVRYQAEGRDVNNLVKFLERLAGNPRERAREELFNWTQARSLTIDEDGYFIGYKAVRPRSNLNGQFPFEHSFDGYRFESLTAGPAFVNGIAHEHGPVPQDVGSTVTLGREIVDERDRVLCSNGLHVGDYAYASGFGPVVMEVRVDPADVVTVPSAHDAKLRCCRYEVVAIHNTDLGDDLSEYEPPATWSTEEFDESLADVDVPLKLRQRLKARLSRKGK